jgi:acetyltransferase
MEDKFYTDPSQNFIERYPQALDAIFLPKTIAVIGAKDTFGSVGRTILLNLINSSFKGKIYPVNPKRDTVFDLKSYTSVASIPEKIDLAIIITPASTVPDLVDECVASGVKAAIIISAGFKELGEKGLLLEQELVKRAKGKMRIIGPNCLGVMNPLYGLNATFAKGMALPGNLAFISQSGAMCTAVLDWSLKERIGFSSFVSIGSMADVNWGDLIDYLGGDPETKSILIYMETIGDPRSFLSAAREIALEKPIIVIKPGRSQEAAKAAASHTGSLAGSDEVFEAAMERAGVLRVNSISELFNMASVLGRQPRPRGPRLSIITNAGGPSVLATDATILDGGKIAALEPKTIEGLNAFLPPAWSHANPVDLLGDASAETYAKAVEILSKDKENDGILVILSPQDMTDPIKTAESLRSFSNLKDRPILASWMGGDFVQKGIQILNEAKIPTFEYPDDAAWSFATMWKYNENLKSLYETPTNLDDQSTQKLIASKEKATKIIENALQEKRTLLNEFESKKLLQAYDIPVVETLIAKTKEEAIHFAKHLDFPVVLKLFSETITHKSDVGGVKLNLKNEQAVEEAYSSIYEAVKKLHGEKAFQGVTVQKMIKQEGYEIILGSSVDLQFGPVILFGSGGILVEIFKDRALGLPPLNVNLAKRLMQKTKIYHALQGVRGRKPVDLQEMEKILVRFSLLIAENPWIKECDINPLLVSADQIIAVDARVVLQDLDTKEFPKLAIRPYPSQYISHCAFKNGEDFVIRPIRPEDEKKLVDFHKDLSESSVRQRFFDFVSLDARIAHERLVRICFNDFDRDIAIVAEKQDLKTKESVIMGVVRLTRQGEGQSADLKLTISDPYHNEGVGTQLVEKVLDVAKKENIQNVTAKILSENTGMIKICKKLGFETKTNGVFTEAMIKF